MDIIADKLFYDANDFFLTEDQTYSAFVRGRLPKHEKPHVELIENLMASVIVDQSPLGENIRCDVNLWDKCAGTLAFVWFSCYITFFAAATIISAQTYKTYKKERKV